MKIRKRVYGIIIVTVGVIATSYGAPATLLRGRLALEDGFYRKAANIFQGILQDGGTSEMVRAEAADFLLRTYSAQNDFDRITAFLDDASLVSALDGVSRLYWQALLLDRQGNWDAVLTHLEPLPEDLGIASPRVLQLQASALLQIGRHAEAVRLFEYLTTSLSDNQQAALRRLDWGRALHSASQYQEAIAVWAELLALTNTVPDLAAQARYLIGETYMLDNQYAQAEIVLDPLAQEAGKGGILAVSALIAQAQSRQMRGDLDGAKELFRAGITALDNRSLRRRLQVELGRTLLAGGDLRGGKETILTYASQHVEHPETPALLLELGQRMIAGKAYEDAISVYQRYLEAFGDRNGVASHGQGLALRGVGRHGEAAMAFEQSLAQAPEGNRKEETLFLAAQERYANGQHRIALGQFEDYIKQYPVGRFHVEARYQRADALAALQQLDKAVEALQLLATDAAETSVAQKAMLRIGEIFLLQKQWEQAELAFETLFASHPEGLYVLAAQHGRGMARYHQWKESAHLDFQRVAEATDDAALREHAYFMQAFSLFQIGASQEALSLCESFLVRFPDSGWAPEVRFRIAQFAFNAGDYATAEKRFLDFAGSHPAHGHVPQGLFRAGQAAIRRRQFVSGNEILGRLAQQYPDHPLLRYARFHQAEALVQLGRHSTAILMFQEVVRIAPNTEIAYLAWGREGDAHFALAAEDATRLEAAARAYQVVLQGGAVQLQDRLQAAYKLGLTYEKMERSAAALEKYYDGVIVPFHLAAQDELAKIGPAGRTWYSRAVRNAIAILERQQEWRSVVRILDRAAGTDADIAVEASSRARAIRSEYWWLFY